MLTLFQSTNNEQTASYVICTRKERYLILIHLMVDPFSNPRSEFEKSAGIYNPHLGSSRLGEYWIPVNESRRLYRTNIKMVKYNFRSTTCLVYQYQNIAICIAKTPPKGLLI